MAVRIERVTTKLHENALKARCDKCNERYVDVYAPRTELAIRIYEFAQEHVDCAGVIMPGADPD